MYQQEQMLQNMHQASPSNQFLKKLKPLVLSLSVFSFLCLHPSWLPLINSFISHFSTFSSQLFSLATDKNYIFLLCNGILVFIAKYSSHTVDTRPPVLPEISPENDLIFKAYEQNMQPSIEKSVSGEDVATNDDGDENQSEQNEVMEDEDVQEKFILYQVTDGTTKEEEINVINDDDDDEDNKEYIKETSDSWSYEEQQEDKHEDKEEQVEEEEAITDMSTEELNRKFEEFIRKMKEDLRIEAQRQLIVV